MDAYSDVISTRALADHLGDPDWAVVDCRFDLKNPAWGAEQYSAGHIPGAVYAHLDDDLAGPVRKGITGRHPLPDLDSFRQRLSTWGIDSQVQVVVYDTTGGSYAARLWWMLHFLGHSAAAILDGGYPRWLADGLPVETGAARRSPRAFVGEPNWAMVAAADEVDRARQDPHSVVIDARAAERYRGEVEPIDPVAGSIPEAVNRFHGLNLDANGLFLPPEALKEQFEGLLAGAPPEQAIVYCGSGVTSAHHLVAMRRAGLPMARLYLGSWSDWITDPSRPIARH